MASRFPVRLRGSNYASNRGAEKAGAKRFVLDRSAHAFRRRLLIDPSDYGAARCIPTSRSEAVGPLFG
jgi:hypothetical protein